MVRHARVTGLLAVILATTFAGVASATLILYEPFDYPADRFLLATAPGAGPNNTVSPIGHLAPNNNNWYGTGLPAATNYQVVNDGQVTATDLVVPQLAKPNSTRSLTLGTTGHTMRLSLNTSVGLPNQTTPNLTDAPDPLAGTDGTLQSTDTAGTGYYSLAFRVDDITGLNAPGGVLGGFNNLIGAQTGNPNTVGAGLVIRPKAGGGPGEFELGVIDQGASGFTSATFDTVNTYTTGTTIFIVGKYQTVGVPGNTSQTDDIAMMWINPHPSTYEGFDPTTGVVLSNNSTNLDIPTNASTNSHTLQSFVLRQTGNVANNHVPVSVTFDELRVGTNYADVTPIIPEPGTFVLALGGATGVAAVRRRR